MSAIEAASVPFDGETEETVETTMDFVREAMQRVRVESYQAGYNAGFDAGLERAQQDELENESSDLMVAGIAI
jgi:hypothetical protein